MTPGDALELVLAAVALDPELDMQEHEIEERLLRGLEKAVAELPMPSRILASAYVIRVRKLVELGRERRRQTDRALQQLFARVEALERPGVYVPPELRL